MMTVGHVSSAFELLTFYVMPSVFVEGVKRRFFRRFAAA
jgi:hypothetical protein